MRNHCAAKARVNVPVFGFLGLPALLLSMPDYLIMLKTFARELGVGVFVVLGAFLLSRLLRRVINTLQDTRSLSPAIAKRLQTFRQRAMLIITVVALMQVVGVFDNAWAFISAGIAAVALGFVAAWSILSNATAAVLVLVFRPFRIGDTVELLDPSGEPMGGQVADMNLMFTTLTVPRTEGDTAPHPLLLNVPNNLFFQRVLRIRSPHAADSKATFFSDAQD